MGQKIIVVLNVTNLFDLGLHAAEVFKECYKLAGGQDKVLAHGVENFKEVRISLEEFHISSSFIGSSLVRDQGVSSYRFPEPVHLYSSENDRCKDKSRRFNDNELLFVLMEEKSRFSR
jgi:hypothetical protein